MFCGNSVPMFITEAEDLVNEVYMTSFMEPTIVSYEVSNTL